MNTSQRHDKALFLQPTIQAIHTVLGLPACIWLLDEATETFRVASAEGVSQEYIDTVTLPLNEISIAAEVFIDPSIDF
jgi:hypothetical protein